MTTKRCCELKKGDRVVMGPNIVRTVDKITPAGVNVLTINWVEGEWTQVMRDKVATMADEGGG